MKKLGELFATAKLPVVLCVASERGPDQDEVFNFSKIMDHTSGKNISILSNLEQPKSILTGDDIDVSKTIDMETAAMQAKDTLAAFKCIASCLNCNHDTLTIPELAEELDNQQIHCMKCGEEVTAYYDGDFFEKSSDDEEDELTEDDSDDVVDALDEEEEDESEIVEDDEEIEVEEGDELESDDPVGEVSDDNANDEDVDDVEIEADQEETEEDEEEDEDLSKKIDKASADADSTTVQPENTEVKPVSTETPAAPVDTNVQASEIDANSKVEEKPVVTEAANEEAPVVTDDLASDKPADKEPAKEVVMTTDVVVASVADYTETLQFAQMADTSRYEVFLGNHHIGSIIKDEASTGIQAKFAQRDLVRNVFGSAFWKHSTEIASGDVKSLKDFGFKPSTVTVGLDKVVADLVEEKVAALEAEHEAKVEETVAAVVASMNVAAAGINKGMIPGTNFHTELSKILSGFGVKQAADVAARFVEKHTPAFFDSVVKASADLRNESPDYVRGLAKSIEQASFKTTNISNNESEMLATSALLPVVKPQGKPAPRNAEVETASASVSIGNVFKRYGHR